MKTNNKKISKEQKWIAYIADLREKHDKELESLKIQYDEELKAFKMNLRIRLRIQYEEEWNKAIDKCIKTLNKSSDGYLADNINLLLKLKK